MLGPAQLSLRWTADTVRSCADHRLWCQGVKSLTPEDLLGLLLRGPSAGVLAEDLLHDGLAELRHLDARQLRRRGLDKANTAIVLAAVELALRLARVRIPERRPLGRIDLMADYLHLRYDRRDQEIMGAVFLDVRGRLLSEVELYRGTLSRGAVEPRLLLKEALLRGASALVAFHTHPSGCPAPSSEDLVFTRRLAEAGESVGVRLADHLILGDAGRWVSLQRRGAW
jgi:DNA repair protein RadC